MRAAAAISGHRVLMFAPGGVVHADPQSPNYAFAGVSTQAATAGTLVDVCQAGELVELSWSWTPGQPLFAGPGGTLAPTPPATGTAQQVAVASGVSSIIVEPSMPIVRG